MTKNAKKIVQIDFMPTIIHAPLALSYANCVLNLNAYHVTQEVFYTRNLVIKVVQHRLHMFMISFAETA